MPGQQPTTPQYDQEANYTVATTSWRSRLRLAGWTSHAFFGLFALLLMVVILIIGITLAVVALRQGKK